MESDVFLNGGRYDPSWKVLTVCLILKINGPPWRLSVFESKNIG
ncbi:hypothetical protein [Spirosoma gilvum]